MASAGKKKLQAEVANLKAKLAATRSERDLMKAVSDELHSKVLNLEAESNSRVAGTSGDAGTMPAERAAPAAELAEAQARAERLAERVAELRLQLSVFAPDSTEAATRAGETLVRARQATERTKTLERQLATARAREDNLVSQIVRNESIIADLEARVLEMAGLEARAAEAEITRAEAEEALTEVRNELLLLRVDVERLRKERDEARARAEAERALAAADRLRAEQAQRYADDLRARPGDTGRIEEPAAELAEVEEAGTVRDEAPAAESADPELADLLAERDELQAMLANAHARLSALEEVAAHAAVLESEMADARARMPEMRIGADAAARRAAELSEALESVEAERDALRAALEGRLNDVTELRARVSELQGTASRAAEPPGAPQFPSQAPVSEEVGGELGDDSIDESSDNDDDPVAQEQPRFESGVASIWLSEGVGGTLEALVDLSIAEPGPREVAEPPATQIETSEGSIRAEGSEEPAMDDESESEMDREALGAVAGRVRKLGRLAKRLPPEDPTSWT